MNEISTLNDLNQALDEIELEFGNGAHTRRRIRPGGDSWGGADVIVTNNKQRKGCDDDYVLITPFAGVIGWYFKRVMAIAYHGGGIDYYSKYKFFRDLAMSVANLPTGADEKQVFNALIAQTRTIMMITMNLA